MMKNTRISPRYFGEVLIDPSFPRKRESILIVPMDSRFRGNDGDGVNQRFHGNDDRGINRRFFRYMATLTIIFALSACGEPPEPEKKEVIRPVKMMTINVGGDEITLEYPGKVSATQSVSLGFEVSGKIIDLPISDGQEVNEGALLGRLDPEDYQAARNSARAQRKAMRSAYNRAVRIFKEGAGSQAEVDKALRDIEVAEEDLKKAQKALNDTRLLAPFEGKIGEKIADNYQNIQAKEPILILLDDSSLEIDVNVPERDFVLMTPDLSHEERTARTRPVISVSSIPDQRFPAHLISFTTTADPVTRTYKATFGFDNPEDVNILPGMTARVTLHLSDDLMEKFSGGGGMLKIPVAATIADEQGNTFVWRVDPESMRVTRIPVKLGEMSGAEVQVIDGLGDGEQIAISGASHLHEDMQVRPLNKQKMK